MIDRGDPAPRHAPSRCAPTRRNVVACVNNELRGMSSSSSSSSSSSTSPASPASAPTAASAPAAKPPASASDAVAAAATLRPAARAAGRACCHLQRAVRLGKHSRPAYRRHGDARREAPGCPVRSLSARASPARAWVGWARRVVRCGRAHPPRQPRNRRRQATTFLTFLNGRADLALTRVSHGFALANSLNPIRFRVCPPTARLAGPI